MERTNRFNPLKAHKLIQEYEKKGEYEKSKFIKELLYRYSRLYPNDLPEETLLFIGRYKRKSINEVLHNFGYEIEAYKKDLIRKFPFKSYGIVLKIK